MLIYERAGLKHEPLLIWAPEAILKRFVASVCSQFASFLAAMMNCIAAKSKFPDYHVVSPQSLE